ncbi:MAG: hypothetical protein Q9227_007037 [Pyrenula ochraceoflavens]
MSPKSPEGKYEPLKDPGPESDYFTSPPPELILRGDSLLRRHDRDGYQLASISPPRETLPRRDTNTSIPESTPLRSDSGDSQTEKPSASMLQTHRSSSSSKLSKWQTGFKSVSSFNVPHIAAPYEHPPPLYKADQAYPTEKEFSYRHQRRALFISAVGQWLTTAALCAAMAAVLVSYSRRKIMDNNDKHVFNALITFFSISLGIVLLGSLRDYASMLKWRLLASGYRSMQEFELILGCESPKKVIRLLWISRKKRYPYISKTQVFAVLWLAIILAAQVLVALVGLTYSIEQAQEYISTDIGLISVADVKTIQPKSNLTDQITKYTKMAAAHDHGIEGQDYEWKVETNPDEQYYEETTYTDEDGTYWMYRFFDLNAQNPLIELASSRTVRSTAECSAYEVIDGIYGEKTEITFVWEGYNYTFNARETSPGAVVYVANADEKCGPRCATIRAVQFADGFDVTDASYYECNNTVHEVEGGYTDDKAYYLPDEQAFMYAGSIAWSGFVTDNDSTQWQLYSIGSLWSPSYNLFSTGMRSQVTSFSMNAIAAMDDHGSRVNTTGIRPLYGLQATVEWKWAAPLLGVIPVLQFLALIAVIAWANKAIIKDDSHLATARLLRPMIDRLGQHGCMLTGDEIAKELSNIRVAYGYREPEGGSQNDPRHVDIIEESEGYRIQRSFPPGPYDGEQRRDKAESQEIASVRKRRRRKSNIF